MASGIKKSFSWAETSDFGTDKNFMRTFREDRVRSEKKKGVGSKFSIYENGICPKFPELLIESASKPPQRSHHWQLLLGLVRPWLPQRSCTWVLKHSWQMGALNTRHRCTTVSGRRNISNRTPQQEKLKLQVRQGHLHESPAYFWVGMSCLFSPYCGKKKSTLNHERCLHKYKIECNKTVFLGTQGMFPSLNSCCACSVLHSQVTNHSE